jgi:heme ABC exporter, ATP-binding protein CcmA
MNKELQPEHVRLTLKEVGAAYSSRIVIAQLSLSLESGDILVVSGANGSGKSTLLRLLCGLQRLHSGEILYEYNGVSYTPNQASHLIGWVSPDLALYRELTALENLRFFAQVRGLRVQDSQLSALLADVGLGGRDHDYVSSYSTGMQQRLRYAYALLHQPAVLLLDEPTVTLDERGSDTVARIIERQRARGIVVIATNDPRELAWGDYVLTLGAA